MLNILLEASNDTLDGHVTFGIHSGVLGLLGLIALPLLSLIIILMALLRWHQRKHGLHPQATSDEEGALQKVGAETEMRSSQEKGNPGAVTAISFSSSAANCGEGSSQGSTASAREEENREWRQRAEA